ncbi:MAG: glycogen debranching enzyme-like protein, partial [Bryobacterales bacterium]|nr:glycogen debranching enzyme-like protein [Bryobacterales bacterium]
TIRFTPDMLRMWPAPNFGRPSAEWVAVGQSGYYILHTDNDAFSGAIGIPGGTPGIMAPYQERPRTYPLELKLAFDPKTQSRLFFPLLMAVGSGNEALGRRLMELNRTWTSLYRQTSDYYAHFFDRRLTTVTPDPRFDLAIRWAELAIDQAQVKYHDETGLVAGYYSSADSARPGFGWFFGRDTLYTLYAVHSYGDFELSRRAMEFLLRRQRADGKIMHEFSQTADLVDWNALPYFYAAADSTPLFVMTMFDYVEATGDLDFLRNHWDAVKNAYAFTRAHDSDGDGIYDNSEGTGWVESWQPTMPHQEVYLAALDQQSCGAMARLSALVNDSGLEKNAQDHADDIRGKLASEYFDKSRNFYAFSRNADGTLDHTATVFPSVAWWNGTLALSHAEAMISRWASDEFSTDWGIRDVGRNEPIYDPISYHQGSVWPLFTGWASLAEYRAGQPLAGYAHLMQNANLTFTQDAGAVTELLSGEYFQPFGRSSSHQLWSSAMVLTPALRGLFGVEADAPHHVLRVNPRLPATWDSAELRNVNVGGALFVLKFARKAGKLTVEASSDNPQVLCLNAAAACITPPAKSRRVEFDLPAVEIELPHDLPPIGSTTRQCKVISQTSSTRAMSFELEGQGGEAVEIALRVNQPPVQVSGASMSAGKLRIEFPSGEGYQRKSVKFTW